MKGFSEVVVVLFGDVDKVELNIVEKVLYCIFFAPGITIANNKDF